LIGCSASAGKNEETVPQQNNKPSTSTEAVSQKKNNIFSSSTEIGRMLKKILTNIKFDKTTKTEVENSICGKQDITFSFSTRNYHDLETRIELISQKNFSNHPQYHCPNVDKVRVLYDSNQVVQAIIYDPGVIGPGVIGDAKSFPIESVLDTFGNPAIVYEGEGSVFLAYPMIGIEIRIWKELKENSQFDFSNWPTYFPKTTYADYVLIFEPMSIENFRQRYMEQYSPYTEINWKGVGNP